MKEVENKEYITFHNIKTCNLHLTPHHRLTAEPPLKGKPSIRQVLYKTREFNRKPTFIRRVAPVCATAYEYLQILLCKINHNCELRIANFISLPTNRFTFLCHFFAAKV